MSSLASPWEGGEVSVLNLVGGENLAWQERKASSFIITPLYCGSAVLGGELYAVANNPRRWTGAYVETRDYGGKEPDLNDNKTGLAGHRDNDLGGGRQPEHGL